MASPWPEPFASLHRVSCAAGDSLLLDGVNLSLLPGEVHALVGIHGGGKSALCQILAGLLAPSAGELRVAGRGYPSLSLSLARRLGIAYVPQYVHLLDQLSVAENFLLARSGWRHSLYLSHRGLERETARRLAEFGFEFDPASLASDLLPSERVVLSILRNLVDPPRLLILDEVLDKLEPAHQERIVALLEERRHQGLAILWVTHNIDHIGDFAGRLSILRKGRIILTDMVDHLDRRNLLKICYNQISRILPDEAGIGEIYQYLKYNEAILQNLPANLLIVDAEQRLKLLNARAREYFGVEPAAWQNSALAAFLGAANESFVDRVRPALNQPGESVLYDLVLSWRGESRMTTTTVFPIRDGGTLLGTILIIEDTTAQERLRHHAILSEKLASVGLLAAGVAHEINNPLEVIANDLNYLRASDVPPAERAEVVGELEAEVAQIHRITRNLATFAHTERIAAAEFVLPELIHDLIELVSHNPRYRSFTICYQPQDPLLRLEASQDELRQVFLNLFRNSCEAMPRGGRICLDTRLDAQSGNVQISFADNGPGIPEQVRKSLFLPFSSTKFGGANMGLGLSIVYGIIQKHQGTITAENLPQSGCRFTIVLPRRQPSGPQS